MDNYFRINQRWWYGDLNLRKRLKEENPREVLSLVRDMLHKEAQALTNLLEADFQLDPDRMVLRTTLRRKDLQTNLLVPFPSPTQLAEKIENITQARRSQVEVAGFKIMKALTDSPVVKEISLVSYAAEDMDLALDQVVAEGAVPQRLVLYLGDARILLKDPHAVGTQKMSGLLIMGEYKGIPVLEGTNTWRPCILASQSGSWCIFPIKKVSQPDLTGTPTE